MKNSTKFTGNQETITNGHTIQATFMIRKAPVTKNHPNTRYPSIQYRNPLNESQSILLQGHTVFYFEP